MAPVFVPMFMLLGYHPSLTQAVFRIGDSITNVITPMMSYFALIVAFAEKYDDRYGMGTIISTMLPYSIVFGIVWSLLLVAWMLFGIPVGPDGPLHYVHVGEVEVLDRRADLQGLDEGHLALRDEVRVERGEPGILELTGGRRGGRVGESVAVEEELHEVHVPLLGGGDVREGAVAVGGEEGPVDVAGELLLLAEEGERRGLGGAEVLLREGLEVGRERAAGARRGAGAASALPLARATPRTLLRDERGGEEEDDDGEGGLLHFRLLGSSLARPRFGRRCTR
jgi:hypothetical protein